MSPAPTSLITPHGGYRRLKSFLVARLVYDITVRFCDRYISKRSRTHDQMVQAARSGVQNIAEGSRFSGTSLKSELKLTNVARGSLDELGLDYEDFLRHRRLAEWARTDPRRQALVDARLSNVGQVAQWIAAECRRPDGSYDREAFPAVSANVALVLIGVASSLLRRQIEAQAAAFERNGGFSERMYRVRQEARARGGR